MPLNSLMKHSYDRRHSQLDENSEGYNGRIKKIV